MGPHHRAQLAAAVAQFLADIRRLARAKLRGERDRLRAALEPSRTRTAATATATLQRPGRRARAAATGPSRGPAIVGRRGPAIVGRRAPKAGAAKPAKSSGRRSTANRPAPERAAAPPPQVPAPAPMAGPPPRLTPAEPAPATSGIRSAAVIVAPVIAAPQAIAASAIPAPVPATPAIEANPPPDGGPGAEISGPGQPAATMRPERSQEGVRHRGIVKWFNPSKGYGFLRGDDGHEAFVHVSAIASAGLQTLAPGQAVEYELRRNAKGIHAVSLTLPDPVTLRSA